MGSYIGFVNDRTDGNVVFRPWPDCSAESSSSSHMAPGLMGRFDAYAGVVELLRSYP